MKPTLTSLFVIAALCLPLQASNHTSANYSIAAETNDSGGLRAASANYTNDGSTGLVAGISSTTNGTAKAGYIAQIFDVTGLVVGAASTDVNETGTLQLSGRQLLDDASFIALNAGSVAWSLVIGPITNVSSSGLVTADVVYQNSPASVQGSFAGFTGSISLNVLDTIPDNFGSYAGDGLPDNWQVQYFGINNPKAAPNVDASGTGQTNLFKYVAGLNPTDQTSRFALNIQAVPGQTGQMQVVFSPVVAGRTYTVVSTSNLSAPNWTSLASSTQSDSGQQRTVTDLGFSGAKKFYRVSVSKP
jgi:hypothetical protein